uniref:Small ribosomal subunit protein uS2c n=1 Tax=Nephroselmis pyriformis TaxID=156128 RepID=A0A8A2H8P5_9CHLO|nr:ribosomal protein S2 [Nephroselmis pyriformis]QSV37307.1 ribosomal protein S2 [Nephroselmis pyriformis]
MITYLMKCIRTELMSSELNNNELTSHLNNEPAGNPEITAMLEESHGEARGHAERNFAARNKLTLEGMLDTGVHFGHQARKWNPKMAPYIYGERNGVHLIDLLYTAVGMQEISEYLRDAGARKENLLLVGTRSQVSELVKDTATRWSHQDIHYVNHRWLGGMLTNWSTIQGCVKKLRELDTQMQLGLLETLPKKEAASAKKQYTRLHKFLGGVRDLNKVPETVLIIGQPTEMNAVRECNKLKLRTITFMDTDCDPSLADFILPANDDSVAAVQYLLDLMLSSFRQGTR